MIKLSFFMVGFKVQGLRGGFKLDIAGSSHVFKKIF